MTRFTVVWVRSAQNELAELWLNAIDRNAVSASAREIDQILARDAVLQGVELSEGLRALFAPPLKVLFAVRESDRVAEVLKCHRL